MMDAEKRARELLEKPCRVADILPRRVEKEHGGFYARAERYFRRGSERRELAQRITRIIIKLLCYFDFEIFIGGEWRSDAGCGKISREIERVVTEERGSVRLLLPGEDTLILINGGDHWFSVYNCSDEAELFLAPLVISEGMFWRRG